MRVVKESSKQDYWNGKIIASIVTKVKYVIQSWEPVAVCACALTSNMQATVSKNQNPKFDESLKTKDLLAPQAYLTN